MIDLEALFSPVFHPGPELVACVFLLPQTASSFSESVYHIKVNEMMVHGGPLVTSHADGSTPLRRIAVRCFYLQLT